MKIKANKSTKLKIKVDKTPQNKRMDGREQHLTLGRLLITNVSSENIVNYILQGYSIQPTINDNDKIAQTLFVVDLLNVKNISSYINITFRYEEIGIPPFAFFNFINNNGIGVYRLLFAMNVPICNKKDINKLNAILRAIAAQNNIIGICPSLIDGGPLISYSFYGDIKVDAKTALINFQSSYNKYMLLDANTSPRIRYPKNWFKETFH